MYFLQNTTDPETCFQEITVSKNERNIHYSSADEEMQGLLTTMNETVNVAADNESQPSLFQLKSEETVQQSTIVKASPDDMARNCEMKRHKTTSRWFLALCDIFSESFSPLLVLLPTMFVHVGVARGTLLMLGSATL